MSYSTCSTADFLNPEYEPLCRKLGIQPNFHRKDWERAFILHHALRTGAVGPGRRALGFAVGLEPLSSAFAAAGTNVTATDAPDEIGVGQGCELGECMRLSSLISITRPSSTETHFSNGLTL